MNAAVARPSHEIEPFSLRLPERALRQLGQRLGRERALGEVWEASLLYTVPLDVLGELVDYWCDDFDYREAEARLNDLPLFTGAGLTFAHVRASEPGSIPLLLLHGSFGSIEEFRELISKLEEPRAHGARAGAAFDLVIPWLEDWGPSSGRACASLMSELGYSRYVAHGSERGAARALELGEIDAAHVAGLHVTACPAFPSAEPCELASLTVHEKSQLALLTELARDEDDPPRSPIAHLALALTQLLDAAPHQLEALRDSLLTSLSWVWLRGGPTHQHAPRHRPAAVSAPLAVCTFPLDAPSLRRFAERKFRVVGWLDQPSGGCLPALEQPELLSSELLRFFERFR